MLRRRRNVSASTAVGTRLFFATDIHGSDLCFRKFLNAGRFYGVEHLVLGGDITGKALVPVEKTQRGWRAQVGEHVYHPQSTEDLRALRQQIRDHGYYPVVGGREELEELADEKRRMDVFREVACTSMQEWVEMAETRLRGSGVRMYVAPGNDDPWEIDGAFNGSELVEFVEGCRTRLNENHEMITTGYSNITPWQSPRELAEDTLSDYLERMFEMVDDPENLVAVLHVPPRETQLDQAPEIDDDFRPRMESGALRLTAVGSSAVRKFIEERQPVLGLHGHVHESKAAQRLGRTICVNPGSTYSEGILAGALITLPHAGPPAFQFVAG